jgi:predicted HTH transcriptional regulator
VALRKSHLNRKTGKEDISPWLVFFFDMLMKQAETAREITGNKTGEDLLSANQLKVLGMFDTVETVTNRDAVKYLDTNRDTAKQVLNRLLKLKLVKKTGAGRSTGYVKVKK